MIDARIAAMRRGLREGLGEWLGFDIPEEGTEDFEIWRARKREIEAFETFADVYACLGHDADRATDFFCSLRYRGFPLGNLITLRLSRIAQGRVCAPFAVAEDGMTGGDGGAPAADVGLGERRLPVGQDHAIVHPGLDRQVPEPVGRGWLISQSGGSA